MMERRKAPRVPVDASVQITVDGASVSGRLRDLSCDAVLVEAAESWPLGTRMEVQLTLPGDSGGPFTVAGDVVRVGAGEGRNHATDSSSFTVMAFSCALR